jgi:hypothetical protein
MDDLLANAFLVSHRWQRYLRSPSLWKNVTIALDARNIIYFQQLIPAVYATNVSIQRFTSVHREGTVFKLLSRSHRTLKRLSLISTLKQGSCLQDAGIHQYSSLTDLGITGLWSAPAEYKWPPSLQRLRLVVEVNNKFYFPSPSLSLTSLRSLTISGEPCYRPSSLPKDALAYVEHFTFGGILHHKDDTRGTYHSLFNTYLPALGHQLRTLSVAWHGSAVASAYAFGDPNYKPSKMIMNQWPHLHRLCIGDCDRIKLAEWNDTCGMAHPSLLLLALAGGHTSTWLAGAFIWDHVYPSCIAVVDTNVDSVSASLKSAANASEVIQGSEMMSRDAIVILNPAATTPVTSLILPNRYRPHPSSKSSLPVGVHHRVVPYQYWERSVIRVSDGSFIRSITDHGSYVQFVTDITSNHTSNDEGDSVIESMPSFEHGLPNGCFDTPSRIMATMTPPTAPSSLSTPSTCPFIGERCICWAEIV